MSKIRVLVTIQPLRDLVLAPETLAELRSFADVTLNEDGRNWDARLLSVSLVDAIWKLGLPQLTSECFRRRTAVIRGLCRRRHQALYDRRGL